jgi:hypothetical protein
MSIEQHLYNIVLETEIDYCVYIEPILSLCLNLELIGT